MSPLPCTGISSIPLSVNRVWGHGSTRNAHTEHVQVSVDGVRKTNCAADENNSVVRCSNLIDFFL